MQKREELFFKKLKVNEKYNELEYLLLQLKKETKIKRIRLVLVTNPRSTQAKNVEKEILRPFYEYVFGLKKIEQLSILKYEVLPTDIDDNAKRLARLIRDNDIVATIGGDGTASIGVNAVIISGKEVKYYTIPYGNFNDIAQTVKKARGQEVFVLEAIINEKHFRYSLNYFTMGMLAESTKLFDEKRVRERLRARNRNLVFSLWELFKWYLRNRRRIFLPKLDYEMNNQEIERSHMDRKKKARRNEKRSDLIVLNGATMARIIRGGNFYKMKKMFLVEIRDLSSFLEIVWFMIRGVIWGVDGAKIENLVVNFYGNEKQRMVEIQSEGEYKRIENVEKIEFKKHKDPLQIL